MLYRVRGATISAHRGCGGGMDAPGPGWDLGGTWVGRAFLASKHSFHWSSFTSPLNGF